MEITEMFTPGKKVRLKLKPSKTGIITDAAPQGLGIRRAYPVFFAGENAVEWVKGISLELAPGDAPQSPEQCFRNGEFGGIVDLRGAITHHRLAGRLANLIYSLNTTNTDFLAYQFKPVLQLLDGSSQGIIIADEVGLGKTIEAGLIWTELQAREEVKRLLVICPAALQDKWKSELADRFGVTATIVNAKLLTEELTESLRNPACEFHLIASLQGVRSHGELKSLLKENGNESLIDLLIVDEAHSLKNPETESNDLITLMREVTEYLVMLTATPIQTASQDLFQLLNILDRDTFAFESAYDHSVNANRDLVALRELVLRRKQPLDVPEVNEWLSRIRKQYIRYWQPTQQLDWLIDNPPKSEELCTIDGRARLASLLEKINPRTKVITRTLRKDAMRDVTIRVPKIMQVEMTPLEREVYDMVSDRVLAYCERSDIPSGFMLVMPQRELSSCMFAALAKWKLKALEDEIDLEFQSEVFDSNDKPVTTTRKPSNLIQGALSGWTPEDGMLQELRREDSKFNALKEAIFSYRKHDGSSEKIVVFSFFKNTLAYLHERLSELGVSSLVLHGGMDKTLKLTQFRDGPFDVLLSSEVAAEGVDLQFSSVLINYDLPWNPAKIEQRIGRIDRIGQKQPKIFIWNFVHSDTIDSRIINRLLVRLNVFQQALGSLGEVLGESITSLTKDLLTHRLTPEQQEQRIDATRMAIAREQELLEELDNKAEDLLGHGDYILTQINSARELGRYVTDEDLYHYVRDAFHKFYEGTRLSPEGGNDNLYRLALSARARADLEGFLVEKNLVKKTRIMLSNMPLLEFRNRLGTPKSGIECVGQNHPLIRFVSHIIKAESLEKIYFPTSAVRVNLPDPKDLAAGVYLYVVKRFTLEGKETKERLLYRCFRSDGVEVNMEMAEYLVSQAAVCGDTWDKPVQDIELASLSELFDQACDSLDDEIDGVYAVAKRENQDRVEAASTALKHKIQSLNDEYDAIVDSTARSESPERARRILPAARAKRDKRVAAFEARLEKLNRAREVNREDRLISAGLIHLEDQ